MQPEDWNNLISQEDVLVLDVRNTYEHSIGTFKSSIQPETTNFREFPAWVQQLESTRKNKDQKIIGAIGVVGPTRLNYAKIVPLVDYTSKIIGKVLS